MPGLLDIIAKAIGGAGGGLIQQMQAAGTPQVYQQNQENARQQSAQQFQAGQTAQAQALAQQNRGSLSAYEQAQLDAQGAGRKDQEQKNLFAAISQGAQPATEGAPGAIQLGANWLIPPAPKTYKVEKDSEVGKQLNLTDDLEVGSDKYLELAEKGLLQKSKIEQKQQFKDALGEQATRYAQDIQDRFNPSYYESLYGKGNIDPQIDRLKQSMLDKLKSAILIDQNRGNTEAIGAIGKSLTDYQSPWEKAFQKKQEFDRESALRFQDARLKNQMDHPDPTDDEIKQGVDAYKLNGLKTLQGLHAINPRLAIAVSQAGAKQGLSPVSLTSEEINNSEKAKVAVNRLNEVSNLLEQPGVAESIGPVLSRYKSFMSGEVGSSTDPRVQSIQNKLGLARQVIGNIHYSARGSANPAIQQALKHLVDADKMDLPTLRTAMGNLKDILTDYAQEGRTTQTNPFESGASAGNPLGLTPKK